jgi:hypothetical protein
MTFPNEGLWRVLFWVDNVYLLTQNVVAGKACALALTDVEAKAFAVPLPT